MEHGNPMGAFLIRPPHNSKRPATLAAGRSVSAAEWAGYFWSRTVIDPSDSRLVMVLLFFETDRLPSPENV